MTESAFISWIKNNLLLLIIWGLVQCSILYTHGINSAGESLRFIQEAKHLMNHQSFSTPVYYMYLIEILLVFIKIKFSFSYHFIIVIQLVLNLTALFAFKKFVTRLYRSPFISLIATLLLTLCLPYQFFNSYIYTESIFFSLSIIYSCYLLSIQQFTLSKVSKIIACLIILCITRPSGIFFAGATFIWFFFTVAHSYSNVKKLIILALIIFIFFYIINNIMGSGQGVNVLTPFKEEHIICDVPTVIRQSDFNRGDDNSIPGLVIYILKHPVQFIRLGFLKTIAFFGLNRPYFSFIHNLFTDAFFYSLYVLIIGGIIQRKKIRLQHFVYYVSLIFIFWMSVVFSCDEWNNRFFLTLTPFLILMAIPFISNRLKINVD